MTAVLMLFCACRAAGDVVIGRETTAGQIVLSMSNLGYFGNLLNPVAHYASCEYPPHSNVEHLFVAGIWVGARTPEEDLRVSVGADDWATNQKKPEYGPRLEDNVVILSNDPLSPNFSTTALAQQHFEMSYDDMNSSSGGDPTSEHVPLGIRVHTMVLAYDEGHVDDFVLIDFTVENVSGGPLHDVYVGWYSEFTVGSTTVTPRPSWNFFDDVKGLFGPSDLENDPEIRMMYAYDPDQDGGAAPSWVGTRLLGTDLPFSTFTYRQWRWQGAGWPQSDTERYETMASGQLDVGPEFETPANWVSMFAVGPWQLPIAGTTARFTIAVVAGLGRDALLRNSRSAQETYDRGFVPVSARPISFGQLKSRF